MKSLDNALDFLQETGIITEEEIEADEFDMFQIYEDSPDIEIPYDLIAKLEAAEIEAALNKKTPNSVINLQNIKIAIEPWKKHENDCGSSEVQIAICNERIKYLTKHLLQNKHDMHAKRGLNVIVNKRRKLLNYLFNTNSNKAEEMVTELSIRFRPPGRLWDKQIKYGAFKNTKSKVEKIRISEKFERSKTAAANAAKSNANAVSV